MTVLAFLDFTYSGASPEELAEEARKLGFVEEVKIIEPKVEGLIADTLSNPLKMDGDVAVIFRDVGLKGLLVGVRERFGSAAEAMLYYFGVEAGRELGKRHMKMGEVLSVVDRLRIYRDISVSMFNCSGYGLMEAIELSEKPPYALIRVHNCFECRLGLGTNKPFSQLVRGMIAGVLTELLNAKMHAVETKCVAKGDPYCEFEVTLSE